MLQLGSEDWSKIYTIPEYIDFHYTAFFEERKPQLYDLVFLDRAPLEREIVFLQRASKAYTLFVTEQVEIKGVAVWLYKSRGGKRIAATDIQRFLLYEARNYFPRPYGEKYEMQNLAIAQGFTGSVKWNGNYSVCLEGDYGEGLNQIVYWRNNLPIVSGQCIDLWLEYRKTPGVRISLSVTQFPQGSVSDVAQKWEFSEEELENVVQLENALQDGAFFVSLLAQGSGKLEVIALHDRYSRRGHGHFLPGGERYVTSDREEIFCYFDPGDLRPPLNVYFSGYKTLEGFEGYYLMRGMGCPFLLVSEARLHGGCFYMGTEEYEELLQKLLQKYINRLRFTPDQVIMSGLSMGTFGALYYGCDIRPHALLLGKPLASIGSVAANERLLRPGGFPTSLDVLRYLCGSMDQDAIEQLNARFWNKFSSTDWGNTKFIVSYMIEDDYDPSAYPSMISELRSEGAQVYGKGIHGRHNDDTGSIVKWFSGQFEKILIEDFGRRIRSK